MPARKPDPIRVQIDDLELDATPEEIAMLELIRQAPSAQAPVEG